MPVSGESLQRMARIQTAADVGLRPGLEKKTQKTQSTWKVGGANTFAVFDEVKEQVTITPKLDATPIIITKDEVQLPGRLTVFGGPAAVSPAPGLSLNPRGLEFSWLLNPIPAFIGKPEPTDGMLRTVSSVLGA